MTNITLPSEIYTELAEPFRSAICNRIALAEQELIKRAETAENELKKVRALLKVAEARIISNIIDR